MPRDAKQMTRHFDFQVEQRKTYIPHAGGYRWTGKWSNVRTDTGESLGDGISEQYGLLQNSVLVESVEEAFSQMDDLKSWGQYVPSSDGSRKPHFEVGKRDIMIGENGSRLFGTYEFAQPRSLNRSVGDTIGMSFVLRNSFDRSCTAGLELAGKRLVCLNGMTRSETLESITSRHTNKINVGTIRDGIEKVLESWDGYIAGFNKFAETEVKQEQGVFILNRLAQKQVLSEAMKDSIQLIWNEQTQNNGRGGELDSDRNLWNLYNAVTQHLTHSVRPKRFEFARKVEQSVVRAFSRSLSKKEKWEELVSPCKSKKEIKVEQKNLAEAQA
jgi:hypothetical protein